MSTAPTPVSPEHMRNVAGLATPWEFYWVLERPAPLAGMAYPRSSPWKILAGEGFESVVCLTDDQTRYDPRPLKILRASRFKELYGGAHPASRAPVGLGPSSPARFACSVFRCLTSSTI